MTSPGEGFYVTGGAMGPEAESYIPRRADDELFEALSRGELCSVLTPSQSGKSSLMTRTSARLAAAGVAVSRIDLTGIGENLEIEQWYLSLLLKIGRDLGLRDELRTFWQENKAFGPMLRWMEAIREVVLPRRPGRVVIFIDEIGVVGKLPFSTDEFFAAIRACYHRRPDDPELERLTFCLLGVATPSELLRDPHTTAFNIGRRIYLEDFSEGEAAPLARGLRRPEPLARRLLDRVLHWTRGHPYLTQRLCREVAGDPSIRSSSGVDRACRKLFLDPEFRGHDTNLKEVERQILKRGSDVVEVIDAYRRTRRAPFVWVSDDERNPAVAVLRISGLTRVVDGCLRVRNRIYARVFDREWIRAHMPDAEVRRQQRAFLRGFALAALVTTLVVGATARLISVESKYRALRAANARVQASEKLAQVNLKLAQENEKRAKINEDRTQLRNATLKNGVEKIYDWQKTVITELPGELRKEFPVFTEGFFKRFVVIALRTSVAKYEDIVAEFSEIVQLRRGLAALYHDQGKIQREVGQRDEGLRNLVKAVDAQREVIAREPDTLDYRSELGRYLADLARAQYEAGQLAEAIATSRERAGLWAEKPGELFEVVRALAGFVSGDGAGAFSDAANEAMSLLKQAVDRGYNDLQAIRTDPVLDPLRDRPDFNALEQLIDGRRVGSQSLEAPPRSSSRR